MANECVMDVVFLIYADKHLKWARKERNATVLTENAGCITK